MSEELIKLVRPARVLDYPGDVGILRKSLNKMGYDASDNDIHDAWSAYSDSMSAGWLMMGDPVDDGFTVLNYLTEESK